jgi:predicted TIM-barrel enzyme
VTRQADPLTPRAAALARLRSQVDAGRPVVGAGAGTGLSAKCAEAGGADLIIVYNSGRYRMAGRGSLAGLLPYGDANAIVVEMAGEVLPVVKETPVLAGVCGTDPFRLMPVFLRQLGELGFAGVQNFPTVGLFDGTFRVNLEETGMGYDLEIEMIRAAAELQLLTAPYVFDEESARAMAEAGADVLVPHMGLTTSGAIGAQTAITLDEAVERVQAMRDAAVRVNPDVLVLCHGGPIAEPEDAAYVLERTRGVVGFFGASSMERLPTEVAITETMRRFKAIPIDAKGAAVARG